ncbi:MAG: IS110 family transposase [Succinatimonas sp.]|nr:IS110 family transposase [Succinatimonas sp.]
MNRIVYIGMDVHTSNYTLCSLDPGYGVKKDNYFAEVQFTNNFVTNVVNYVSNLKKKMKDCEFVCGYEAGCLGYSTYKDLTKAGIKCVIMAPSTMAVQKGGKKVKNDRRDARVIAQCLAYQTYKEVYVLSEHDEAVRGYLRMRDSHKKELKRIKQQIIAFCTGHGLFSPTKSNWTVAHLKWLKGLKFNDPVEQEIINEYLSSYTYLCDKIKAMDVRIEVLASEKQYCENVKKLRCIKGIETNVALTLLAEIGDFNRFSKPTDFAAYLGLIPGEQSSGDKVRGTGITKAGNSTLRQKLTEAAKGYWRGRIGMKSATFKKFEKELPKEVTEYALKANTRLQRKFFNMTHVKGKNMNVAASACAREMACFVWGLITNHYDKAPAVPKTDEELLDLNLG